MMARGGIWGGIASVVITGAVAGCSNGVAWNSPVRKYTAEETIGMGARRGYTEVRQGNKIYVASTFAGVKRIKEGKEPVTKVAAIGFGPRGEKVVFEASKDGLVEKALMDEFQRRHGGGEG